MFESVIAKPIFVIFLNDDLDMLHADTKPQGLKKSSENWLTLKTYHPVQWFWLLWLAVF